MKNVMGIIMTGGKTNSLNELTAKRSGAAIPVGGKYRAIDFTLSNMVNSGITNIGVITQYNFRSLIDHLGSGKEWDLDRKNDGLFVFPPFLSTDDSGWYRGTADAMYHNLSFLRRSNEDYVIIAQGNGVYKMIFDDLLNTHISKGSDITIAYREMADYTSDDLPYLGILQVNNEGRVVDFQEKPPHPKTNLASLGIYMMRRELLIELIEESTAHGSYDFVKDILIKKLDTLKIDGYRFDGYWRNISTVQLFYRCNMEMLDPEISNKLFVENGRVYTKVKDETPAKYNEEAEVRNSIVADGCIIEGIVENSVLFRGVTVKKGAVVRNSIIMQGAVIEEKASLQYTILDKNVVLSQDKQLKGEQNWPIIIGKNVHV